MRRRSVRYFLSLRYGYEELEAGASVRKCAFARIGVFSDLTMSFKVTITLFSRKFFAKLSTIRQQSLRVTLCLSSKRRELTWQ